jgi:hypothetical protein
LEENALISEAEEFHVLLPNAEASERGDKDVNGIEKEEELGISPSLEVVTSVLTSR